jgi:uncharacterized protein (DUF2249 family)
LGKFQNGSNNPFFGKKHDELSLSKMRNPDRKEQKIRYKTKAMCHSLLWRTLRVSEKKDTTYSILGYTPRELRIHLESLFESSMSWENHGRGNGMWHIDHIRPINTFDANAPPSIINSLSNLRPLWAAQNIRRPKDGSDVLIP